MTMLRSLFLSLLFLLPAIAAAQAAAPAQAECVVPSKPGGAMDLTCKLAKKGLAQEGVAGVGAPMRISYLPGGIGAVAWHSMVSQRRRAEPNTLVAFSGGSLLNLAQGKFGNAKAKHNQLVSLSRDDAGFGDTQRGLIAGIQHRF